MVLAQREDEAETELEKIEPLAGEETEAVPSNAYGDGSCPIHLRFSSRRGDTNAGNRRY